jgi:hypothetical protein
MKTLTGNLQLFELKQLADMENDYKARCKKALADYKIWGKRHAQETDMIAIIYGNLQGQVLRCNAQESVRAYWTIRKDFRCWFNRYLKQTTHYPANNN